MKATVNRKDLLKALTEVKPAVPRNPDYPYLMHVLLMVTDHELYVTGTDMVNTIQCDVPVMIDHCTLPQEGQCTVNHKRFIELVKIIADDNLELEVINDQLSIMSNGSSFSLAIGEDDNLELEVINDQLSIMSNGSSFSLAIGESENFPQCRFTGEPEVCHSTFFPHSVKMLKKSVKFVSTESGLIALTGISLEFQAGELIITASNACRLINSTIPDVKVFPAGKDTNCVVPTFAFKLLERFKKEKWHFRLYKDRVTFSAPGIQIMSKLVEGPYPDYRSAMPKALPNMSIINRENLLLAVDSLLPCTPKPTKKVVFDFNRQLNISANNKDTGANGNNSLDHEYSGKALITAFNGQFVCDILKSIDSAKVKWFTDQKTSTSMFCPAESSTERYLLMPLRLNE